MKEFRFDPKIHLNHGDIVPLRAQIISQMRQAIITHRVKAGTRVISERALSLELGINRNTVHQAYEELVEMGLFSVQSARGGVRISPQAHEFYKQPFPTINIIMPYCFTEQLKHFSNFGLEMFGGVLDRAAERQVSVQILSLPPIDTPAKQIREFLDSFVHRSTGIITMGRRTKDECDPVLTAILKCKTLPHVLLSACSPAYSHISSVMADLQTGGRDFLTHLKKQNISVIGGFTCAGTPREILDHASLRWAEIRDLALREGFAVREYMLDIPEDKYPDFDLLAQQIIHDPHQAQCLVTRNDDFACSLADALHKAGKSVPEDYLLTGYDDLAHDRYSLSSFNHSRNEMGRLAVDMVLELAERHSAGETLHKKVPTYFTARKSTELRKCVNN